jgi:polysaccharide transporter, PST family
LNGTDLTTRMQSRIQWVQTQIKARFALLTDMAAVYGIHFANQALPLVTVPYLSRILAPSMWGLVAMAHAFAMYGSVVVEYGFVYSATRLLATAETALEFERALAGVVGAKMLLSAAALLFAAAAGFSIPVFRAHPLLFWTAVLSELIKAWLPVYYFYGIKRVAIASLIDILTRAASAAGIFILIHKPEDAWKFFALNGTTAGIAAIVAHLMIYSRYSLRLPRLKDGVAMVREGWPMFLFRSAHNIYTLGNAFILGLFASPQVVGYYAGAEKISSAAVGLLSPFTTVLYPRAAGLVKTSLRKAARVTELSVYAAGAASALLTICMWVGAIWIIPLVLGSKFVPSEPVFQILSLRAPMVAWINVLGFQWLLALSMEREFQRITLVALVANVLLAALLAPGFLQNGMALAVVISQLIAALGLFLVLQRRGLNPFALARSAESYA